MIEIIFWGISIGSTIMLLYYSFGYFLIGSIAMGIFTMALGFIPLANILFLLLYWFFMFLDSDDDVNIVRTLQKEYNKVYECRECGFYNYKGNSLAISNDGKQVTKCCACDSTRLSIYGNKHIVPAMKKVSKRQAIKLHLLEQGVIKQKSKAEKNTFQQNQLEIYIKQQEIKLERMKGEK